MLLNVYALGPLAQVVEDKLGGFYDEVIAIGRDFVGIDAAGGDGEGGGINGRYRNPIVQT